MIKLTKKSIALLLKQRFAEEDISLKDLPNPSLLLDGVKGAKRVAKAILNKEKITIVGDYDVDGVVSTTILSEFFEKIAYPVDFIIPNRFTDGYGVSPKILEQINADVVITVDNGISAVQAAIVAKNKGIDLIITDHHTVGEELPDAYAIINPKQDNCTYPFKEICGAQVAWLFAGLIKKEIQSNVDLRQWFDVLSIAIIADVMPLVNINRTLVKTGLKHIQKSTRPAMIIIRKYLNKSVIGSEDIAFQISPRINSAGRMEDASIALNFLRSKTKNEAFALFESLSSLNDLRKSTEAKVSEEAIAKVNKKDKVILVANTNWHEGVVGIVASRLVGKFAKPAFVLSIDGQRAKGSGRSLGEVNLYDLLDKNDQYILGFGGHKLAAGLAVDINNLDNLRLAINKTASLLDEKDFIPKEEVLGELDYKDIDLELLELIEQFEPFGQANPRPKFLLKNVYLDEIKRLGKEKEHAKLLLKQNSFSSKTIDLLAFRCEETPKVKENFNCIFTLSKNEYMGKVSLQLMLDRFD